MKVAVLHPGAMGSDLGRALSANHDVLWVGKERSADTRARAAAAGLAETATLADLVAQSDVAIAICPPHAAMDIAREVAQIRSSDFLYVDANTVAPATVRSIAGQFRPNVVVDATLTGSPGADNLTIWVSGARKSEVCDLFSGTRITCRAIGNDVGQASAFKICAGLRSKVIPALWATLIEAAATAGPEVEYAVREHLGDIGYDLDREANRIAERAAKAWRWIGEMEESAAAMRELGLPTGFSEAAAATYQRIASTRALRVPYACGWLYGFSPYGATWRTGSLALAWLRLSDACSVRAGSPYGPQPVRYGLAALGLVAP
jgi:3-hydroxyisobutyrate dehydrogenase-like beta-hydroxyacid dehydrogenase